MVKKIKELYVLHVGSKNISIYNLAIYIYICVYFWSKLYMYYDIGYIDRVEEKKPTNMFVFQKKFKSCLSD